MITAFLFNLVGDKQLEATFNAEQAAYQQKIRLYATAFILGAMAIGFFAGRHYGKTGKIF